MGVRGGERRIMVRFSVTVAIGCLALGCGVGPIGGPPGSEDGTDRPVDGSGLDATIVDGGVADEGNEPPVALAMPLFGEGPDEILDGRRSTMAFLDGSNSSDPDGSIVSWDWFMDGSRVAIGANASIGGFPVGVTTVTLVVTDDLGGQAEDDIRVINPGFRPGRWRGVTSQGYEVEFQIGVDLTLEALSWGFEFAGENLLNGAPCMFVSERQECPGCSGSVELCLWDVTWGAAPESFAVSGACVEEGDPPYEHGRGSAQAVPSSNCAGSAEGITWEAWWESDR